MIRIVHQLYWRFAGEKHFAGTEEYEVPVNTERPSQHRSNTAYVNRQLPLQDRTRGDVAI